MSTLKYFGITDTKFTGDFQGWISRTGYTGDLGYELWVDRSDAHQLWDLLLEEGKNYGLEPAGLNALDISRVEAGFVLRGVDYIGANEALIAAQKSTPFELGLGWTIKLKDRDPFIGKKALQEEKKQGSKWALVGLEIDWLTIEKLFANHDLPPQVSSAAWRDPVPVYSDGRQIGRATSGSWSPILKKNLALATVEEKYSKLGTKLDIEYTVEWARETVPAVVTKTPFFNPERKKQ